LRVDVSSSIGSITFGNGAFANSPNLVSASANVFSTAANATWGSAGQSFWNCTSLSNINFNKVGLLNTQDFSNTALTYIDSTNLQTTPNAYATGFGVFSGSNGITTMDIDLGGRAIVASATPLTTSYAYPGVSASYSIGSGSLLGMAGLVTADIGVGYSIRTHAFRGASALQNITISNLSASLANSSSIEELAFLGSTSLVSASLNYIWKIMPRTFETCTSLSYINAPNTPYIESGAFSDVANNGYGTFSSAISGSSELTYLASKGWTLNYV
jgi:hypothetical protein